jgi:tetratricopeptide (TPR) repeat protein
MLQGGDADRALDLFQRVLATSPTHAEASAGAGAAAFRLGDFAAAARYLRRAPEQPEFADLRATAEFVLSRDPRAPRIRASERRRRLTANLVYARMQLEECAASAQIENVDLRAVQAALDDIERRLKRAPNDQDVVDDGIGATYRAGRPIGMLCAASSPLDRALVIIGERQGAAEP